MDDNEIIDKYYNKIYKLCLYNLNDDTEAEDLTQDIFFKVFKNIVSFKYESQIYTWIYRIAVNTIINYSKRKKIIKFLSFNPESEHKKNINDFIEYDPARMNEITETEIFKLNAIENSMKLLSAKEKTAFYLFCYDNLKQKEIAKIMKSSVSSIESLIFKSKRKIKKEMARLYPDICQINWSKK